MVEDADVRRFGRFIAKVDFGSADGCWLWTAAKDKTGYGRFNVAPGTATAAHRYSYALDGRPIPPGFDIDHLCRVRACVRPDHLEAVTRQENLRRGAQPERRGEPRTHCWRGHDYTEANTGWNAGKRVCRACGAQRAAAKRAGLPFPSAPRPVRPTRAPRPAPTMEERFWAKVDKTDTCWLWTAAKTTGYGSFGVSRGRTMLAHRVAYLLLVGPIPPDQPFLDHLCNVKACVNPDHLEPVTNTENLRRHHRPRREQTECVAGHPMSGDNVRLRTNGLPICRTCASEGHRRWRHGPGRASVLAREAKRRTGRPPGRPPSTHCKRGHAFDDENTYVDPKGRRRCRTCRHEYYLAEDRGQAA